jgi:hypothetical protein
LDSKKIIQKLSVKKKVVKISKKQIKNTNHSHKPATAKKKKPDLKLTSKQDEEQKEEMKKERETKSGCK